MNNNQLKTISILSVLLLISLVIVSIFGGFVPGTYEKDAASMAAQGIGQDIVNLFIVVPLLIISLIFMRKESKIATLLFGGTIFYILYSFIIYCFGVHFNQLFLLYCATLGLSLYIFIIYMMEMQKNNIKEWFSEEMPNKLFAWYLIIIATLFYVLWLKDVVPAIIGNYTPKSVADYKLLVNPVHVIDIAIALPGLIIAGILLLKKQSLGYILVAICLVFVIVLTIALAGMVIVLQVKGISEDLSIAVIFGVLALISLTFLIIFLRNIKHKK